MPESQDANFRVALAHESAVAIERDADTFIWWPTGLLACFNNKVLGPVNVGNIQRWIAKLMEQPQANLNTKAVNIQPYNDRWNPIECHPILEDKDSFMAESEVLHPGDYCLYFNDSDDDPKTDTTMNSEEYPTRSFWAFLLPYPSIADRVRAESSVKDGDLWDQMDTVPKDLLMKAALRPQSQGTCVLTGSSTGPETQVITQWIIPPMQSCNVSNFQTRPDGINQDDSGFTDVANLITMRRSLYQLFLENAFGIDVEDNFRIYTFHPSAKTVGLPARLDSGIWKPDERTKYFLGEHFRWCLNVHFHGGSIREDKLLGRTQAQLFISKVDSAQTGEVGVHAKWKLKKGDWESRLGKGIIEFMTFINPEFKIPDCVDVNIAESGSG